MCTKWNGKKKTTFATDGFTSQNKSCKYWGGLDFEMLECLPQDLNWPRKSCFKQRNSIPNHCHMVRPFFEKGCVHLQFTLASRPSKPTFSRCEYKPRCSCDVFRHMPTNFGTKILHLYKYNFLFSHGQCFCTTASVRLFYKISGVGIELRLVKSIWSSTLGCPVVRFFSLRTLLTAENLPSSPPCHDDRRTILTGGAGLRVAG